MTPNLTKAVAASVLALTLIGCDKQASTSTEIQTTNSEAQEAAANQEHLTKVQTFYDFLSNPGSNLHTKKFLAAAADDWESIGNFSGKNKNRDGFVGQLGGFSKLIPDLKWDVQSMSQQGNRVTVHSRATGTPVAPFFGVDGQGRSFDIMTIDIHELEDGMIARTYHVEDWAGALQQLKGPNPPAPKEDAGEASKKVVMAYMDAMGKGDMETMKSLMADDMVWHNEGDSSMPWIGPWKGKENILSFLGIFSENVKTTLWESGDVLASGDTVAMFGRMKLQTTKSGKETKEFTYSLRVKVQDGKIVLWNWFEDSFAVSGAFHGK